MAASEAPNPVDIHVGNRVRQRRKLSGLSQANLAEALDLTFQQVQKYERGTNRMSASKLFQAAAFLRVPVAYFFDGLDLEATDGGAAISDPEQAINAFLSTVEGIELASTFARITSANQRRKLLGLVAAMAEEV